MIDRLRGTVLQKDPDLLLSVGPIVLRLEITDQTRRALPGPGNDSELFAELIVREDSLGLVGFATREERRLFRILTGISGVGKRLSLAILSAFSVAELARTVTMGDKKRLTEVGGVGSKTAARLLLELSSKLDEFLPADPLGEIRVPGALDPRREEALLALLSLGLSKQAADKAIAEFGDVEMEVEEMIRRALGAVS